MKENVFGKDKMSNCKKKQQIFCLFGPLIRKWFVSLNDKKTISQFYQLQFYQR